MLHSGQRSLHSGALSPYTEDKLWLRRQVLVAVGPPLLYYLPAVHLGASQIVCVLKCDDVLQVEA